VQTVNQQQSQSWQDFVEEIEKIDVQETQGALRMGDLFILAEETYGPKNLQKLAENAGVSWSVARQRLWVSKRIPKDSIVRKMKALTFGHLRALAATDKQEEWATKVETEDLTVRDLIEAIDQSGDKRKVENGFASCADCGTDIVAGSETYVAVSLAGGKRNLCCNAACAINYLNRAVTATSVPEADPFTPTVPTDAAEAETAEVGPVEDSEGMLDAPSVDEVTSNEDDPWAE
jgi:hypothetical protein